MISMARLLGSSVVIFLISFSAHARGRGDGSGIYFGGGMQRSASTFKSQSTSSNFTGWGGAAVVGVDFSGESSGPYIEAEYGKTDLINSYSNATYLEKASNAYVGASIGFRINAFSLGGGARQNDIHVDNVTTLGTSGRSSYSGLTYFGALRATVAERDAVRSFIEVSHAVGQLQQLDLSETQISIKFVFSPF